MNNPIMMKCGHAANAIDEKGNPCCVICISINKEAEQIEDNPPDLKGRLAKCGCCKNKEKSSFGLAFFEYRGPGSRIAENRCHVCGHFTKKETIIGNKVYYENTEVLIPDVCINKGKQCVYEPYEFDGFYCGCMGWD